MEYSRLGSLTVSRVGYGCYGMSGVYGRRDPAVWGRALRLALELGITYFDAAETYGPAEELLGRELGRQRDQVALATKVGIGPEGRPDLSPGRVVEACEGSLQRLGTTWIDLYQVHFDDPHTPVAETVTALEQLKESGKIREYGVGHLPPARVAEYIRLGRPASVLCELSPVARAALDNVLPPARENGVAAVAFSPTGRGMLSGAIRPGHQFEEGDFRRLDPLFSPHRLASGLRIHDQLARAGNALGKTAVQMSIAWVLAQQGVAAALTGPANPDHLRENAGAAGWEVPAGTLESIDRALKEEETRLAKAALEACRGILSRPVTQEGDQGYGELVFLIDTAVEHGWARESAMMPLVLRLMGLRKAQKGQYHPELEEIRLEVARAVGLPGEVSAQDG